MKKIQSERGFKEGALVPVYKDWFKEDVIIELFSIININILFVFFLNL